MGTLWLLSPEPEMGSIVPVLTVDDIVFSEDFFGHMDRSSYNVEKLTISEDQHIATHTATIGQCR